TRGLNNQLSRDVYTKMLETGESAEKVIAKSGIKAFSDDELRSIISKGINDNPKAVADYNKGNAKAIDRIKGAAMKETKGHARMDVVQKLLEEELAKVWRGSA